MRNKDKIIKKANREFILNHLKMRFRPFAGIALCLFFTGVMLILYLLAYFLLDEDSLLYSLSFALLTGVIASSIITISIEMNHNNQRNKKRWVKLEDYFRFVTVYQAAVQRKAALLREFEANDKNNLSDFKDPRLDAWRKITSGSKVVLENINKDEYEYAAIAEKIKYGIPIFETVYTEHYDLLSNKEMEIISGIMFNIESMKAEMNYLVTEEVDINEFYAEAHGKSAIAYLEANKKYTACVNEYLNNIFPEIITRPDLLLSYECVSNHIIFIACLQDCDENIKKLEKYIYKEPGYSELLKINKHVR